MAKLLLLQEHVRVQVRDPYIIKFVTVEYSSFLDNDLELENCEGLEESLKMRAGVEEKKVAVDPSLAPTF